MTATYRLVGLLGGTLLLGSATAAWAETSLDEKLEERVETRLKSDTKLDHLDVDVKEGVVTLTGEVASAAERARAEKLVRAEGAKRVVNRLEIDADKAIARVKDTAEAKKDRIDDRAERQKEQIDRQTEVSKDRIEARTNAANTRVHDPATKKDEHAAVRTTTTEPRKDSVVDPWVTTKVKTKILADDLLDKSDINVDTDRDGVVTLKGTVATEGARTRALELARTTEGVRKVVDRLAVKAPITR
jgi:osmotically-inducible protein OsmY